MEKNTFRIVDIRCDQYGTGAASKTVGGYTGIFPIITTAPMAMYYQQKIANSVGMDKCFQLVDVSKGI